MRPVARHRTAQVMPTVATLQAQLAGWATIPAALVRTPHPRQQAATPPTLLPRLARQFCTAPSPLGADRRTSPALRVPRPNLGVTVTRLWFSRHKRKSVRRDPRQRTAARSSTTLHKGEFPMSSVPHPLPSRMTHNVAALFGHTDDTLLAWQQACVHAADTLQPPPDPERLAKALALAQDGAVRIEDDGDALVTSGDARYRVRANGTCLCPDAQHRGVPCKHTLAVQIHQQATASLAPSDRVAAPRAATPPASTPDPRQDASPAPTAGM